MAVDEARPTDKSLILWDENDGKGTLSDFLDKNPPSKTCRAAGGDGWIWVISKRGGSENGIGPTAESLRAGKKILSELSKRFEEIDSSTTIPRVKSKTSGPSKKMLKEAAAEQCEKDLRSIGEKQWPCGKWMFFEGADYVDGVFSQLARSIVHGPLSELKHASCHTIKVATSDSLRGDSARQGRPAQQLICVYFDNVWNSEHATEVLECMVKDEGQIPNSAKADLYTMIGLDSNHPSKLRSTLYRPSELHNWEQLREWQFEYRQAKLMDKKGGSRGAAGVVLDAPSSSTTKIPGRERGVPSSTKRKYGDDGVREPVDPNDFWPTSDERHDDQNGKAVASTQPVDEDGSETEPESGEDVLRASPTKSEAISSSSPSGYTSKAVSSMVGPPERKRAHQEPLTSFYRQMEASSSTSPEEKIKKTPLVVLKPDKKRDRFGRSDF